MRVRTTAWLLLLVGAGCHTNPPAPLESTPALTETRASAAIADHVEFSEPIWTEIWSHRPGPSSRALEARGLLRFDEAIDRLALTEDAVSVAAREGSFQEEIPVFYFPVARRTLAAVREIAGVPDSGLTRVRFEYRMMRTDVGATIAESGGRLGVDDGALLHGTAYMRDDGADWRVVLLDL